MTYLGNIKSARQTVSTKASITNSKVTSKQYVGTNTDTTTTVVNNQSNTISTSIKKVPHKLKINELEYDGSQEVTLTLPDLEEINDLVGKIRENADNIGSNANRLTNLDTANMSKTIEAGRRQAHEIKYLEKHIGLENIGNKKTQLVASIRKEYISKPLDEIASMVSKELNEEVTKSNVNHIFRRIHELYLREKK